MSDSQFFERFEETAAVCEYLNDLFYEIKLILYEIILNRDRNFVGSIEYEPNVSN